MAEVFRDGLALPLNDTPEGEEQPITHVRVHNHNDFPISDMYDSKPYVFTKEKAVPIPLEVANHFFGFELEGAGKALAHTAKRYGWNLADNSKSALEWFDKLEFKPVRFMLVEASPEPRRHKAKREEAAG